MKTSEVDFLKKMKRQFDTAEYGEGMSANLASMSFDIQKRIDLLIKEQEEKSEMKNSELKVKIKVQSLLSNHTRTPMGMFHGKELDERGFLKKLFAEFTITPKS